MDFIRLKVFLKGNAEGPEIRRLSVPIHSSWAETLQKLNSLFGSSVTQAAYVDSEGDRVVISSQEEWAECLAVMGQAPVLHLHLERPQPPQPEAKRCRKGRHLQRLALQEMEKGQYAEALLLLEKAIPCATNLYNIACCRALMGQDALALNSLKAAVAAGYLDWEHMCTDPDLQSLRDSSEFQAVIQDLKDKAPALSSGQAQRCHFFSPWRAHALERFAEAKMAERNFTAAMDLLDRAQAVQPSPRILYLKACCHSLMGDADKALAGLEAAVARGFRDVETAMGDERLAAVRDEEQFRALVDQMLTTRAEAPAQAEATPECRGPGHFPEGRPLTQVLPALAVAAETIGPQIVAAVNNLNPQLGSSLQTWLNLFRNSIATSTGQANSTEAPAPAEAAATAAEQALEEALAELQLQEQQEGPGRPDLVFALKAGGEDYADCTGTYVHDPRLLNGKPVYVNAAKSRFIGFDGSCWQLTGTEWFEGIMAQQGEFGSFHHNSSADPMLDWANYNVTSAEAIHDNATASLPAMEVDETTELTEVDPSVEPDTPAVAPAVPTTAPTPNPAMEVDPTVDEMAVEAAKLSKLQEMGFFDTERNRQVLAASGGSLTVALTRLLEA